MLIELHDATPAAPGQKHGPGGPTHCANLRVDYEYQLEQWLISELAFYRPDVVRVVDRAGRRQWVRRDGTFVPTQWPVIERVDGHPWVGAVVRAIEGGAKLTGTWRVDRVVMQEGLGFGQPGTEPMEVWAELVAADGSRERAVSRIDCLELVRSAG